MPQPETPRCPRRGSHSLASWQPPYENTGHHRPNAGCPVPRTRNNPSNFAPPACKNTQTNFAVCSDPVTDKDGHTACFTTATRRSQPPSRRQKKPSPSRGLFLKGPASRADGPNNPSREPKAAPVPAPPEPQPNPKPQACPFFTAAERNAMHPEWPGGAEVQGVFGATLKVQPKQFVWFWGRIQSRLATPGQHGNLQLKIKWQALPEWGDKTKTSNLEFWDDRQFPECPVQLCIPPSKYHQAPSGQVTSHRHGWRSRIHPRSNCWRQRSTSNCAWDNHYCRAAQSAPEGPPGRTPTKSPMRSSLKFSQRTRRPVRRRQSSRPARRACHGELQPRRHVVAGIGPQNLSSPPQPNPNPRQDRIPVPHHMGQGSAHIPPK